MECQFIFKEFDLAQLADGFTFSHWRAAAYPLKGGQLADTLERLD